MIIVKGDLTSVFKIDRAHPWPPELDVAPMRAALQQLRDDAARMPALADVERALNAALAELDEVEAVERSRLRLSAHGPMNRPWHRGLR